MIAASEKASDPRRIRIQPVIYSIIYFLCWLKIVYLQLFAPPHWPCQAISNMQDNSSSTTRISASRLSTHPRCANNLPRHTVNLGHSTDRVQRPQTALSDEREASRALKQKTKGDEGHLNDCNCSREKCVIFRSPT